MGSEPFRILVVSDDPAVADSARHGFSRDTEVEVVPDARAGLASLRATPAGAVLIDLQTGSAGGFALRRDMGEDERLASIPVLMLLEREQDAWLAREAGADAIAVKPLAAAELAGRMRALTDSSTTA